MSRIGLITRITAAEGKRDELLAALQLVLDEVHKASGTVHRGSCDPGPFLQAAPAGGAALQRNPAM